MTRNATSQFDSFDPEVIEAARDVASRAGVPLEAWIASVAPQHFPVEERGQQPVTTPPTPATGQAFVDAMIAPDSDVQEDVMSSAEKAPSREAAAEPALPDGFAALMNRLDGLDRSMEAERRAAAEAEQRRLSEIEQRIDRALHTGPVQQVTERLGDIERRVAQLGDQVAGARPPGKRGKAAAEEMRDAVQAIRQRQRELAVPAAPERKDTAPAGAVASMHRDIARRLVDGAADTTQVAKPAAKRSPAPKAAAGAARGNRPSGLPPYVIQELKSESARLREALAALATDTDIEDLDKALDTMAVNVGRARSDADVPAIALPLAVIRTRVEELETATAGGKAYAQIAADMKHFAGRLNVASAFEEPDAERSALDALTSELDEFRAIVGTLAAPERIRHLGQRVADLSLRLSKLPSEEELKRREHAAQEEIRRREVAARELLRQKEQAAAEERRQQDIVIRAEAQRNATVAADEGDGEPTELADEIHALAEKMDHLQARAEVEAVVSAEAGTMTSGDVASIHAMLHSLAEKVDRVGERKGPSNLDALEKQVLTLVDKIEAPHALDPALSSLERTMNDLMHQVEALREAPPSEILIEKAARRAAAETVKGAPVGSGSGEFGLIQASLADMQARQIASDERLSATLEGVQSALDRLVTRLGAVETSAPRSPSLDERLLASASTDVARGSRRAILRETTPEPTPVLASVDAPLEPGAPRPLRGPTLSTEKREAASAAPTLDKPASQDGDIKTSFIAAARRAAQAAQAELAAEMPLDRPARGRPSATVAKDGRVRRLRSEIDQHRRPLLLGLAAIVLTLGAIQAVGLRSSDDTAKIAQLAQSPATTASIDRPAEKAPEKAAEASKPAAAPQQVAETSKPTPAQDPSTTQALVAPKVPELPPAPAKPAIPPVADMNGLAGELGNVPPALAKVKQAALAGDGLAVWELAMREADGRGMPRDLSVATKLFEKLAAAGYAPAQYKLGAHFEKGSGVTRDLAQAKLWYGRAAEQGHARAMHNLGVIYAENPGAGGKPDFATAASWFRQGAEHGVRDSQYNIAVLYARGLGLTQDLVQSYTWFSAAAAQGDDDAGKKRDDVATKLSAPDLARAKSLAASFKPRKLDAAVNDPPTIQDNGQGPMSLLGAPAPLAVNQAARKAI